MRRYFVMLALFMLALVVFAQAQIPVTDDTFTTSCALSTSFGSSIALIVQSPTATGSMTNPSEPAGCTTNAYVRFDIAGTEPSSLQPSNIFKATVRLYVSLVISPGTFDVYLVNGSWSESTLTLNTAPALGTLVKSGVQVSKGQKYIDVDVTNAMPQAWLPTTTGTNYGLVLKPSSGSNIFVAFDSKENPLTGHDPELYLVLISAGPQGPQGIQGPQGVQGPMGTPATVLVGPTTTLAPGSSASVNDGYNSATNTSTLSFSIPQGAIGAQGPAGSTTGAVGLPPILTTLLTLSSMPAHTG